MSLLQLYPDPDLRPELRGALVERIDVIAVPGISSSHLSIERNALDTFTAPADNGRTINWLRDHLPLVVPHSRISIYCYDAFGSFNPFSWRTLQDLSENFLKIVFDSRRDDPHRPIILIAHSLGGLIIKQALLLATQDSKFASVRDAVKGILFFGTPHRATGPEDSIESIVKTVLHKLYIPDLRLKETIRKPTFQYASLPHFSESCHHTLLNSFNASLLSSLDIVSFYESIGSIVPKENAILGHPRERVASLHASHRNLCRYGSAQDLNYKIVKDALSFLVERALLSCPDRKDLGYSDAQLLCRLSPAYDLPLYRIHKGLPGTCEWLLNHPAFLRWTLSPTNDVAWIIGRAGTGKSTLIRFLLDTFQKPSGGSYEWHSGASEVHSNTLEAQSPRVLSFFCSYAGPPIDAVGILRSLLYQLLAARPSLLKCISTDDTLQCTQKSAQASQLGSLLAQVATYQRVCIFIDALDELEEVARKDLLDALLLTPKLLKMRDAHHYDHSHPTTPSFKILFSSRHHRGLPVQPSAYMIDLSQGEAAEGLDHDIRLYTKWKLNEYARQAVLPNSEMKTIQEELVHKAQGVFLWVNLVVKTLLLSTAESPSVISALANLPKSLGDSYSRALRTIQRLRPDAAAHAFSILRWVLYAKRPLTVSELSEALRFETVTSSPRPLSLSPLYIKNAISLLRGSLIEIDKYDSSVRFLHTTVKEYLQDSRHSELFGPDDKVGWRCEESLARVCVAYITQQDFEALNARSAFRSDIPKAARDEWSNAPMELSHRFPFLEYASVFWFKHLNSTHLKQGGYPVSELGELATLLSDPKSAPFRIWFPIFWLHHCTETWERRRYPEYPTELLVLVFLGNETKIRQLLRQRREAIYECTPAGEEWTPLMAAAWMGNESIIDLLLAYNVAENVEPRRNARALVQAIERGHSTIAKKLIAHFTNVPPSFASQRAILDILPEEEGITPLIAAIRLCHSEVVTYLLNRGADVNKSGSYRSPPIPIAGLSLLAPNLGVTLTPLGAAIYSGSTSLSKELLHSGADITSSNAIFIAASNSNHSVLDLLIDYGADVNMTYHHAIEGRTTLLDPATCGTSSSKQTPLYLAALYGRKTVVELFLRHGAQVDLEDERGWTPLQMACISGNVEVAEMLLNNSTQSSISAKQALFVASSLADYNLVKLLLPKVASAHGAGLYDWTSALDYLFDVDWLFFLDCAFASCSYAASAPPHPDSRTDVLELLLRVGANVGRTDAYGNTYLHLAAGRRWSSVVNALLKSSKIDINQRNDSGETAIDIIARFGDDVLCKSLIDHGATVSRLTIQNAIDSGSRTGLRCLLMELERPDRHRPEISMESYSSNTDQALASYFSPGYQSPVATIDLSMGERKKAAEFLYQKNIDSMETIKLTTEDHLSFGNRLKSWIEDYTGTAWIWWPLAPRYHPLKAGEVWMEWPSRDGKICREKISRELAQDIEQLLGVRHEASNINTNEDLWEGHRKPAVDSVPRQVISAAADESRLLAYPSGQRFAPPVTPRCTSTSKTNRPTLNPESPTSSQPIQPSLSNPTSQSSPPIMVAPPGASVKPSGRQAGASRSARRHQRPAPSTPTPPCSSNDGRYVLVKTGNTISNIDAGLHNTDALFFSEYKRVYKHARGWIKNWFSPFRYHHSNFDKFTQSFNNDISSLSTGSRTSNFFPEPPHDRDYVYSRVPCAYREAPISQCEFRSIYRACNAFKYPPSTNCDDKTLQLIPKRTEKWPPPRWQSRSVAWGLTPFDLPSFLGFLVYFILSAVGPTIFWGLWLSVGKHKADLQNASIPAAVVIMLWALLFPFVGLKWNTDRESV